MDDLDNTPLSADDIAQRQARLAQLQLDVEAFDGEGGDSMLWLWAESERRQIVRELEAGHRLPEPDNLDELTGLTSPPFKPEDAPWTIRKTTTKAR
jgi:hypothetical protein